DIEESPLFRHPDVGPGIQREAAQCCLNDTEKLVQLLNSPLGWLAILIDIFRIDEKADKESRISLMVFPGFHFIGVDVSRIWPFRIRFQPFYGAMNRTLLVVNQSSNRNA